MLFAKNANRNVGIFKICNVNGSDDFKYGFVANFFMNIYSFVANVLLVIATHPESMI